MLSVFLLAPLAAEAKYRFEDGVYLGPASTLPDWADYLARVRAQQPQIHACLAQRDHCPPGMRGLPTLLERARDLEPDRQLRLVNRYVNTRRYRGDRIHRLDSPLAGEEVRLKSRWSTLLEFFGRGGDCEEYATSKYELLRLLGVASDDLRVVVVYDRGTRAHHAVLAVRRPDGSAWLLDSDDSIHRGHPFGYRFIYALNESAVWDHELEAWARPGQPEEPS